VNVPLGAASAAPPNPSNPPNLNETINGRNVGDINNDGILDAILVSAGNIGDAWGPSAFGDVCLLGVPSDYPVK
jgi:hypothetical protein